MSNSDRAVSDDRAAVARSIAHVYEGVDAAAAEHHAFESTSLLMRPLGVSGGWGLHGAGSWGNINEWIKAGAPIDGLQSVEYGDGLSHWETPLLTALIDSRLEVAKQLIKAGASVDAPCAITFPDGFILNHTALHMVAQRGLNAAAIMLIQVGADVNCRTSGGTTALHFAAGKDNEVLVKALLSAGADPHMREFNDDIPGGWGESPIDQAGPNTRRILLNSP